MTDDSTTTRSVPGSPAVLAAAGRGPGTPAGSGPVGRPRRGVTERQRPLWLLIPGGLLMTLIIVLPLLLAIYIGLIDLDQYTLRRWLDAPFIGMANFTEAF